MTESAVVLFSGGLDSTTCVAIAHDEGYEPVLLSFDYTQKHDTAIRTVADQMQAFGVKRFFFIPLQHLGHGSALVEHGVAVPKGGDPRAPGVPSTYVPARNLIFLAYATAVAEQTGSKSIFIGCSEVDFSGYPDCRGVFLDAFSAAARLGTVSGDIIVRAPLLKMPKAEIIKKGLELGVDYSQTFSCYDPQHSEVCCSDGKGYTETLACGTCDACQLRLEGFREAGEADPIQYLPDLNLLG